MVFFQRRKVAFEPIDPLGNGLREEIAREQAESDHFVLSEQIDGSLADKWEAILVDARNDPDFIFADDES